MKGTSKTYAITKISTSILVFTDDNQTHIPDQYYKSSSPFDAKKLFRNNLSQAIEDSKTTSPTFPLKIFAFENAHRGGRKFMAAPMDRFLGYLTKPVMNLHEVWMPTLYSKLAFDIDVKLTANMVTKRDIILTELKTFILYLWKHTSDYFSNNLKLTGELELIALSCHRSEYLSYHITMHLEGVRFLSPADMGIFALYIGNIAKENLIKSRPDRMQKNGIGKEKIEFPNFILDNIYIPHKTLRTAFSSKMNNPSDKLILDDKLSIIPNRNTSNKEEIFGLSLIQYNDPKEIVKKIITVKDDKTGLGNGKFRSSISSLSLWFKDSSDEQKIAMEMLAYVGNEYDDTSLSIYGYFKKGMVLICSTPSQFCRTKGAAHGSNRVYYIINMGYSKNFTQKCFNKNECLKTRRRYGTIFYQFPEPMWESINRLVKKLPQPIKEEENDEMIVFNCGNGIFENLKSGNGQRSYTNDPDLETIHNYLQKTEFEFSLNNFNTEEFIL